jgi:L-lysine 2,3-aminomutase
MRQSVEKSRIYQLANSIKTLEGLKQFFYFSEEEEKHIQNILRTTRMSITPYLINLIETEKGRIKTNDPIWLQYGPSLYE